MAVTAFWFCRAAEGQFGTTAARRIDWVTDTIKVTLHTVTFTPDQDAHDFYDDLSNELTTAGGYTAGGATLGTKTVNLDTATNVLSLRAADTTWTGATFTARRAVIRKDTGAAGTSPLLGWVDFGADQSPAGIDFVINWHDTDGVLKLTVA